MDSGASFTGEILDGNEKPPSQHKSANIGRQIEGKNGVMCLAARDQALLEVMVNFQPLLKNKIARVFGSKNTVCRLKIPQTTGYNSCVESSKHLCFSCAASAS